jgi:hypothetical protein
MCDGLLDGLEHSWSRVTSEMPIREGCEGLELRRKIVSKFRGWI